MFIIWIILARGVQISEGPECRQYNFVGNSAGARREGSRNSSGDNRSHCRLHKCQPKDIPALSVSIFIHTEKKPRLCELPLTSKWRVRESLTNVSRSRNTSAIYCANPQRYCTQFPAFMDRPIDLGRIKHQYCDAFGVNSKKFYR